MNLHFIKIIIATLLVINNTQLFAENLNADNYSKSKSTKSVVIVAANWGRQWQCGAYENAQLINIEFLNLKNKNTLKLETPSRLNVKPEFLNYGYIVEPGTYAISAFSVKVAKSSSEVGYFSADKNKLIPNNNPKGGTFTVKAGEVAYIGHYFIDCYKEPIPWRFYPEGKEAFNSYVNTVKSHYEFLEDVNISFNILNTTVFGNPYELK